MVIKRPKAERRSSPVAVWTHARNIAVTRVAGWDSSDDTHNISPVNLQPSSPPSPPRPKHQEIKQITTTIVLSYNCLMGSNVLHIVKRIKMRSGL